MGKTIIFAETGISKKRTRKQGPINPGRLVSRNHRSAHYIDQRLASEKVPDKTLSILAEQAAKTTINRMMPSIIAYVKKNIGEPE